LVCRRLATRSDAPVAGALHECVEGRGGPAPAQLVDVMKERRVRAQRCQILEQERELAAIAEYIWRKIFELAMAIDETRRGDCADSRNARVTVGAITNEGEVIRDVLGIHAELGANGVGVANLLRFAIHLHDAVVAHALREILVRRPDAHFLHCRILGGDARAGRETVVGFEIGHRPNGDAHRGETVFERLKLRDQRRLHSIAGFVAGPQIVSEGFNDVVRRNGKMRRARLEHLEHGVQYADDGAERWVFTFGEAADAVEVTEQFIGPVEQMNDHGSVYDTTVADVYRDDQHPYTFAAGRERNVYTSRTSAPACLSMKPRHSEISMTRRFAMLFAFPVLSMVAGACADKSAPKDSTAAPTAATQSPDSFRVVFETSRGPFVVQVLKAWAPRGADRFYELVQQHFFDDTRFFRVVPGFVVQFGLSGDPKKNEPWDKRIPDDSVRQTNARGTIVFATQGPNTRTHQLFINLGDNARLDGMGFAPIGRVVEGMSVVDSLYSDYGESPDQQFIQTLGNSYLDRTFPKLDRIKTTKVATTP
jgi:peptidyl-prolyl cis-trans isomerase A (cyclophilin A)